MRQPKTWQLGKLWGQAADKSPRGSARWRGWGRGGVCAAGGCFSPTRPPWGRLSPVMKRWRLFASAALFACFSHAVLLGAAINLQNSPLESSGGVGDGEESCGGLVLLLPPSPSLLAIT